jgi:hypothetical protein
MVSESSGMLYVLSLDDGSTLRTIPLPGAQQADWGSWGIVAVDGFWWHTDYQEYTLYKLDPADGAVLETRDMHFTQYLGIAWDGTNLWGAEPGARGAVDRRKLHRIDIATGDILETIPLPHIEAPIGLTWDGAYLWVSERDGDQIHQIDREGRILNTITTATQGITGIGAQMPYLWYAQRSRDPDQGVYLLHRCDLAAPTPHTLHLPVVTDSYVTPLALSEQ